MENTRSKEIYDFLLKETEKLCIPEIYKDGCPFCIENIIRTLSKTSRSKEEAINFLKWVTYNE